MSGRGHNLSLNGLAIGLAIPVLFLAALGIATIHASETAQQPGAPASVSQQPASEGPQLDFSERLIETVGPLSLKQLVYLLTGIALFLLTQMVSYRWIGRYAFVIYGVVIFLLLLLIVDRYINLPLIPVVRSTRRWIDLGVLRIQPSEFMKVALILALARYLRFRSSYRRLTGLVAPFLLTLAPMALILKQPDLGTLLMLLPVLFVMVFVAGARLRHLAVVMIAGAACLIAFYSFGAYADSHQAPDGYWMRAVGMKEYQRQRIQVLLKQNTTDEKWQTGPGYQLRQGLTALGTGGVLGEGYGGSLFIQQGLLPEEHNDFIFALIGNQWGFVGCALVIIAYIVIVVVGLEVALVTNDPFGRLLAVGVVVMIVAQALLNICMNIGLAPITGMTLPFVSSGGSSLWANFIALGLLVNVATRRAMLIANPPFEHRDD